MRGERNIEGDFGRFMTFGISQMSFGISQMGFGISQMTFGISQMSFWYFSDVGTAESDTVTLRHEFMHAIPRKVSTVPAVHQNVLKRENVFSPKIRMYPKRLHI